jgi:amino acid transporter
VKTLVLIALNMVLVGLFLFLFTRKRLLTYHQDRRLWLTWLSVAIITLMDEVTPIFYAPAESYQFIGASALVFIALTSLLMRFMSTRYTEIAEILERHKIIGGGVYSFSYFVLGPTVSFIAVASIQVDYILTACISSVSAIGNALPFTPFAQSPYLRLPLALGIIWLIAGLNIAGLKANARFTYGIFLLAAFVMLNLIASGLVEFGRLGSWEGLNNAFASATGDLTQGSWLAHYGNFVTHISFCILAYSGIESVIQTAGLVRSWHDIRKAYWFLALTVGLVTPLVSALVLTAPIDIHQHELDLFTHYATLLNGVHFGILVAAMAFFTLSMAVNTAFVASSELLERVAQRYRLTWLIATNRRQSFYRIHILNAICFSVIVFIAGGQQDILAEMFAVGLVASFCINTGCLLIYRYYKGTSEIDYHTSRLGTLILWIILVSCFGFLAAAKVRGTILWASVSIVVLVVGLVVSRRYGPEIAAIAKGDTGEDLVAYLGRFHTRTIYLFFRRGKEPKHGMEEKAPGRERLQHGVTAENSAYITFYSPRVGAPPKVAPNHFRFPLSLLSLYQEMAALLELLESEFPHRHVVVNIGWPLSSWFDRLSITVRYMNIMRLPRRFPGIEFIMRYITSVPIAEKKVLAKREAQEKAEEKTGKP